MSRRDLTPLPLVNRLTLAAVLGIGIRTLDRLEDQGVIAPAKQGKGGRASEYDLSVSVVAFIEHERKSTAPKEQSGLSAAKLRLAEAKAREAEHEEQVRTGLLIKREQVIEEGRSLILALKAHLLALPSRAIQLGAARDSERILAELVRAMLIEITNWKSQEDTDNVWRNTLPTTE
jgi:phage terminase Nu1 subunit (DNA packaging protein)